MFGCLGTSAKADEGGVSVWLPGFFGSLAASPLQPGSSLTSIYYHTTVSAGSDVAKAREITTGRIPVTLNANLSASIDARADLAIALPTYTFATPVFGAQATVGVMGVYGRTSTSLAGTLSGSLSTPLGTLPFSRFDSITDAVTGFGDVYPLATLRWNNGVHNVMTYVFGDVPVGAYDSTRLSNIGVGHGAIDIGGGYTYLNPQTGHEFSGVLGFTYNFANQSAISERRRHAFRLGRIAIPNQTGSYRRRGLCLYGARLRQRLRRSRGLLPVAGRWRRAAGWIHHSPDQRDARLSQPQKLLGICQPEPARRVERLGHVRDLAGGTDAEHRAETNRHEVKRPLTRSPRWQGRAVCPVS
jgi:hypothetical protein